MKTICITCKADCHNAGTMARIIECSSYKPGRILTNADRIRAMSDEELAKYLSNPCECTVDPERDGYRECGNDLCVKYLLEWLQQPAEEEKL